MNLLYLSLGFTVVANTLYHLFQKSISTAVHPLISIILTYLVAIGISLILLLFFPLKTSLSEAIKAANWATYALAIGLVGIELGFLLMYRFGWNLSIGAIASNVLVTLLLIPIGIIAFKEDLSLVRALGIIFALLGIALINWKS